MVKTTRFIVYTLLAVAAWLAVAPAARAAEAEAVKHDVWLDIDTATGVGDVDDGIMLLQALRSPELRIRGVSVLFGNATLDKAVPIARHILDRYGPGDLTAVPGAATADELFKPTAAVEAMARALRDRPMHLVAVGPLTNVATLLYRHPELHDRIESIVMVAARRPGQRFVVVEDQPRPFPDANFEKDVPAMRVVLDSDVPLVFAPWEVSTSLWLHDADLDALRETGGSGAWVERTSFYWQKRWETGLGTDGFTPFDTLAIAWFTHRDELQRMPVSVAIETGPDDGGRPYHRTPGEPKPYLVVRDPEMGQRRAVYLYRASPQVKQALLDRLAGRDGDPGPPSGPLYPLGDQRFDHSAFDTILRRHVDEHGLVHYETLAQDAELLDVYLEQLGEVDIDKLTRDERFALLINAYNAFTLRLILDHAPLDSIRSIPPEERWQARRWNLGGRDVSLDEIEHIMIRPVFNDPRMHFAVVCAAVSCPPLLAEAYTGDRLDEQLDAQTRRINNTTPWLRYDPDRGVVVLTRLYDWYRADFVRDAEGDLGLLRWIAAYHEPLAAALADDKTPKIQWADYDWSLNRSDGP